MFKYFYAVIVFLNSFHLDKNSFRLTIVRINFYSMILAFKNISSGVF